MKEVNDLISDLNKELNEAVDEIDSEEKLQDDGMKLGKFVDKWLIALYPKLKVDIKNFAKQQGWNDAYLKKVMQEDVDSTWGEIDDEPSSAAGMVPILVYADAFKIKSR